MYPKTSTYRRFFHDNFLHSLRFLGLKHTHTKVYKPLSVYFVQ